ncbi:MAG: hypothetical protein N3D73_01400 [Candidatus Diapherotrites archaeon]|nr:hypothetical protein [Candidatus Diapherotrites archaeon]
MVFVLNNKAQTSFELIFVISTIILIIGIVASYYHSQLNETKVVFFTKMAVIKKQAEFDIPTYLKDINTQISGRDYNVFVDFSSFSRIRSIAKIFDVNWCNGLKSQIGASRLRVCFGSVQQCNTNIEC